MACFPHRSESHDNLAWDLANVLCEHVRFGDLACGDDELDLLTRGIDAGHHVCMVPCELAIDCEDLVAYLDARTIGGKALLDRSDDNSDASRYIVDECEANIADAALALERTVEPVLAQ